MWVARNRICKKEWAQSFSMEEWCRNNNVAMCQCGRRDMIRGDDAILFFKSKPKKIEWGCGCISWDTEFIEDKCIYPDRDLCHKDWRVDKGQRKKLDGKQ